MIVILLAAYNGEKFLKYQIESILAQTCTDWKLVVQDDCSTDSTYNIALCYAHKYPDKIAAFSRRENSGSAANNFFGMLQYADGDYMMFSDGDDIWLPEKLSVTLEKMRELEAKNGESVPLLVHTDLKVVDSRLREISGSLLKREHLDFNKWELNHLLAQNIVTGCTLMANKRLVDMIGAPPVHAAMHDWWLALTASAFGEIGFVKQPTVLYRQHGANLVGAKNASSISYYLKRLLSIGKTRREMYATFEQAREFYELYGNDLADNKKQMLKDYILLPKLSVVGRVRLLNRYDFWKSGFLRRCGQVFIPPLA